MPAKAKYKKSFCKDLIEHRAQGYSYESFAADIGTSRQSLYAWEKKHPEWLRAKQEAKDAHLKFMESIGIAKVKGEMPKNSCSTTWIFMMKTQHNDIYGDRYNDGETEIVVVARPKKE